MTVEAIRFQSEYQRPFPEANHFKRGHRVQPLKGLTVGTFALLQIGVGPQSPLHEAVVRIEEKVQTEQKRNPAVIVTTAQGTVFSLGGGTKAFNR